MIQPPAQISTPSSPFPSLSQWVMPPPTQVFKPNISNIFWLLSFSHTFVHFVSKFGQPCFPDRSRIYLLLCLTAASPAQVTSALATRAAVASPYCSHRAPGRVGLKPDELMNRLRHFPFLKTPSDFQPQGHFQASYYGWRGPCLARLPPDIVGLPSVTAATLTFIPPQALCPLLQILSQLLSHFGPSSNVTGVSKATQSKGGTPPQQTCYTLVSILFYGLYNFLEVTLFIRYEKGLFIRHVNYLRAGTLPACPLLCS